MSTGEPDAGRAGGRAIDGSAASGRRVESIVIYRPGSLGDTVAALPCFHKLAQAFPEAKRYVLTNLPVSSKAPALELILENSGLIDGVISYPLQLRSLCGISQLARRLRALKSNTLVYLPPTKNGGFAVWRDLLAFRLLGFSRIVAAPWMRDRREARIDATTGFEEYECGRLARNLAELGPIDLDDRANWDLRLTEAEKNGADQVLHPFGRTPFIAVNMGGKVSANDWGSGNWRSLFEALGASHGGYGLLFVGAEEERERATVAKVWPGPTVNACGILTPRQSAAALARASLFIGHDSGPMHLAAAVGLTCVAPFSGNNVPRRWHPYGANHRIVHRMDGIANVGVEEIAAHVRDVLAGLPGPLRSNTQA